MLEYVTMTEISIKGIGDIDEYTERKTKINSIF